MMKVMEREGKLGELEVRAETLQQGSEQFQVNIYSDLSWWQKVAACTRLSKSLITFLSTHRGLFILDTLLVLLIGLDHIVSIDILIMIVINLAYIIYSAVAMNRRQH